MRCACQACKKGVKEGPTPTPGVDGRPWGVADADGTIIVRSWHEDNAKAVAKIKGDGHTVVKMERRRRKVKR